jgi:hypothetical protein
MYDIKISKSKHRIILSLLVLVLFLSSCRTTRQLPVFEIKPMPVIKILKKIEHESPIYENYESKKITIDLDINNEKNSLSGQFKNKRNKCIILTIRKLSIPLGKGLITPDSVFFVNYLDKSYLAGDFSDIQKLIGVDINYNLIQALLTSDISKIIQNVNFDRGTISDIDSQMYRINSRFDPRIERAFATGNEKLLNRLMKRMNDSEFIEQSIWVDPQFFVIRKISLNDIKSDKNITIRYNQFELVGNSLFPQELSLNFFSPTQKFSIILKLSKSSVNSDDDFSFSIPEKYEKLK